MLTLVRITLFLAFLASAAAPAMAQDTLFPPVVEKGALDLQWRGFSDISTEQTHLFEAEYAPFERAAFSLEFGLEGEDNSGLDTKTVAVEARVQFLPTQAYFFDVGALFTYLATTTAGEPDLFEANLLVERDWRRWEFLANFTVQREIFGEQDRATNFLYSIEARYRLHPLAQPGLQAFGEPGQFADFDPLSEQQHLIGPALFGDYEIGRNAKLIYDAGVLFNTTAGEQDTVFRWEMIFQYRF